MPPSISFFRQYTAESLLELCMRYTILIEINLCSINGICNCYKLLGGYWCEQPPAAKDVQRTRPSLCYLHTIIERKNLPCIPGLNSALIWSRQQFLYTILTCKVNVPSQRVLADRPSKTTPETEPTFLLTSTSYRRRRRQGWLVMVAEIITRSEHMTQNCSC